MAAVGLAKLTTEYPDTLELEWKSFLLRPNPDPQPLEKFRRYTRSWRRPASVPGAPEFREWATDEPAPSHSIPGQVALKAAARQGSFAAYHLAMMKAYFYDNRDVTDPATATELARACGLEAADFVRDLDDQGLAELVVAEHMEATRAGISSVPTVVVDGILPIPGAQELRFYRHVVDKRLAADD